ncbi:MAG: MATE family efflux transporter [Hyphomicrobiaceae bacterium]|nr:MAG: MATE family efflux transporter [Hyphomicrobiaceae bacterium]
MTNAVSAAGPVAKSKPDLLTAPILPMLLRLALPNVAAMLVTALVAIAETVYMGLLGTTPLAAMALVFPMAMLTQMMSAGAMGGGVSSAISRALGAGDATRAQMLALHAVVIGACAGLAFTAFFLMLGPAIFGLLGGSGRVLDQALIYSNMLFAGAIAIWLCNTLASIVRGTGNMQVPSLTLLLVAAIQIALGGGLSLGLGPFPRTGIIGVAAGQIIAYVAGALFLLWFLLSGRARITLAPERGSLRREMFLDILKVGAVAAFSPLQAVLTVLILTGLVAGFGTEALAGYGIGARLEFLLVPIVFALGVACVPMVGMAIGAGDVARARSVAWMGGLVSVATAGAIGLVVAVVPDLWSGLFTTDAGVRASANLYLRWAGPCFGFFGLGLCLYFASQGAGRVVGPVLASTLRLMVIAAGGLLLSVTGAPAWGLFALVGLSMLAYGLGTAGAVYVTAWGATGRQKPRQRGTSRRAARTRAAR